MLDSDNLGVVDTGLPREPFALDVDSHPDRGEPEFWLSVEAFRLYALFRDDAVLLGLDAPLLACLAAVG